VVVREAVRILSTKGVLEVRQGRQTEVKPIDTWDHLDPQILLALIKAGKLGPMAQHLVEVRKMLEAEAAGLAAEKATEEDIKTLHELLDATVKWSTNAAEYLSIENQLHIQIWRTADNVLLWQLLDSLNEVFLFIKHLYYETYMTDQDYENHLTVVKAIENHDAEAAREAMVRDITRFDDELRAALESGAFERTSRMELLL
jgi:DNA-binding FadR family transcriptional regulator